MTRVPATTFSTSGGGGPNGSFAEAFLFSSTSWWEQRKERIQAHERALQKIASPSKGSTAGSARHASSSKQVSLAQAPITGPAGPGLVPHVGVGAQMPAGGTNPQLINATPTPSNLSVPPVGVPPMPSGVLSGNQVLQQLMSRVAFPRDPRETTQQDRRVVAPPSGDLTPARVVIPGGMGFTVAPYQNFAGQDATEEGTSADIDQLRALQQVEISFVPEGATARGAGTNIPDDGSSTAFLQPPLHARGAGAVDHALKAAGLSSPPSGRLAAAARQARANAIAASKEPGSPSSPAEGGLWKRPSKLSTIVGGGAGGGDPRAPTTRVFDSLELLADASKLSTDHQRKLDRILNRAFLVSASGAAGGGEDENHDDEDDDIPFAFRPKKKSDFVGFRDMDTELAQELIEEVWSLEAALRSSEAHVTRLLAGRDNLGKMEQLDVELEKTKTDVEARDKQLAMLAELNKQTLSDLKRMEEVHVEDQVEPRWRKCMWRTR